VQVQCEGVLHGMNESDDGPCQRRSETACTNAGAGLEVEPPKLGRGGAPSVSPLRSQQLEQSGSFLPRITSLRLGASGGCSRSSLVGFKLVLENVIIWVPTPFCRWVHQVNAFTVAGFHVFWVHQVNAFTVAGFHVFWVP